MNGNMQVTDEAVDKITSIVANHIMEKVFDGVNWALILNTDTDTINEYESIRQELKDMGYTRGEVLRALQAPNGLIYDIDSSVIKRLVVKLLENSENASDYYKLIDSAYIERRNLVFQKLHIYIMKAFKQGKTRVSVALFSTNKGDKITYKTYVESGKYAGQTVEVTLPAFALRHWDLQELNRDYLIPSRVKISKVHVIEILPTRTGVGFNLDLVGLDE